MKHCYLALLFFVCASQLYANPTFPPSFKLTSDSLDYTTVDDTCWQMLEDSNGIWTINDVSSASFENRWHHSAKEKDGIGKIVHTYWLRYRLKNITNNRADIVIRPNYADAIDLYFKQPNGNWQHQKTGLLASANESNIYQLRTSVPVTVQANEEVIVYEKRYINTVYFFSINRPDGLSVQIQSAKKFAEDNINTSYTAYLIQLAFVFGFLLIASVFNFFFFLTVKERSYFYFSLFILFFAINYCNDCFDYFSLFIQHPHWLLTLNIWQCLSLFFEVYFVRSFFRTHRSHPVWDKYFTIESWAQLFLRLLALFAGWQLPRQQSNWLWSADLVFFYITNGFILFTFFISIPKSDSYKKLMLFAVMPFAVYFGGLHSLVILFSRLNIDFDNTHFPFILWLQDWDYTFYEITICWLVIVFSLILFLRYKNLQNKTVQYALERERLAKQQETERTQLIEEQKIELEKQVEKRTSQLNQSLQELKSTQAQLIQSEKMASLGELTAGIAHEIQNPLNFVNNFSEVSRELIEELQGERKVNGKRDEQAEDELLNDIKQNLEKINHHGKRADSIVKGMLQHSRKNTGAKEFTDINALCDEYLRLSYHGLRAKDKSFNADFKSDFDDSIGKINIVPQDMGRVLLNLYNNAFYAVSERQKVEGEKFKPLVSVQSKKQDNKITIQVTDNGRGIAQSIINKIFQPFFTTKPTGQGTGLGLSLAYDIITKEHNGTIKVESEEGKGTTFIIVL